MQADFVSGEHVEVFHKLEANHDESLGILFVPFKIKHYRTNKNGTILIVRIQHFGAITGLEGIIQQERLKIESPLFQRPFHISKQKHQR